MFGRALEEAQLHLAVEAVFREEGVGHEALDDLDHAVVKPGREDLGLFDEGVRVDHDAVVVVKREARVGKELLLLPEFVHHLARDAQVGRGGIVDHDL